LLAVYLGLFQLLMTQGLPFVGTVSATAIVAFACFSSLLDYGRALTQSQSHSFGQVSERATAALVQGVKGLRYHSGTVVFVVGASLGLRWALDFGEVPGNRVVLSSFSLAFATRMVFLVRESASLTLLRVHFGLGGLEAAKLFFQGQDANRSVCNRLGVLGMVLGMFIFPTVFGLLPLMLMVPLYWLYFREVFLGETGLSALQPQHADQRAGQLVRQADAQFAPVPSQEGPSL
jgi:hypothetical protein